MKQRLKIFIKSTFFYVVYIRIQLVYNRFVQSKKNFWVYFKYYIYNHHVSYFPSYQIRILYLRHVIGILIGKDSFIHMGCFFEGNATSIGNNTVIGRNCYLGGGNPVDGSMLTIKNNVSITAQTYIFCNTHHINSPIFEAFSKSVIIEDYAWVGARAMILPGVRIGKGSVLGAASTATKDIPDYCVYAGTPAIKIGDRAKDISYNLLYFPPFQ